MKNKIEYLLDCRNKEDLLSYFKGNPNLITLELKFLDLFDLSFCFNFESFDRKDDIGKLYEDKISKVYATQDVYGHALTFIYSNDRREELNDRAFLVFESNEELEEFILDEAIRIREKINQNTSWIKQ